ncbi:MAG: hypothetical protein ACHQYP_04655 [Nitrospiria bacterium]
MNSILYPKEGSIFLYGKSHSDFVRLSQIKRPEAQDTSTAPFRVKGLNFEVNSAVLILKRQWRKAKRDTALFCFGTIQTTSEGFKR